jgi:hypothetical protein
LIDYFSVRTPRTTMSRSVLLKIYFLARNLHHDRSFSSSTHTRIEITLIWTFLFILHFKVTQCVDVNLNIWVNMIYYLGVINNIHVKVVARSSSHAHEGTRWEMRIYKRGTLCRYFKRRIFSCQLFSSEINLNYNMDIISSFIRLEHVNFPRINILKLNCEMEYIIKASHTHKLCGSFKQTSNGLICDLSQHIEQVSVHFPLENFPPPGLVSSLRANILLRKYLLGKWTCKP